MKISPIAIPLPIKKAMCSTRFAEIAENTVYAVTIETGLKMAGRPAFIYTDKETNSETKKYAAVKEFLYQGTCLGLYLSIVPKVKAGIYRGITNVLSKDSKNKLKIDMYNKAKLAVKEAEKTKNKELYSKLSMEFKESIKNNKDFHLVKGAKELSAIIGSVVTLAIIAPQLSRHIVHPMMKALGFKDKKAEGAKSKDVPEVNVKA